VAKIKIGYHPQTPTLNHPADRRRLVFWAKKRGHEITLNLEGKVDVLVLSGRADITAWSRKKNRAPLILDLVDGYLGNEHMWRDWIRGVGKVIARDISGVPRPYRKIVADACANSQAVICATVEQRETIIPYCANTHAILDFHEEYPMLAYRKNNPKENFPSLMWEGMPFTAKGLLLLQETFSLVSKTQPIRLNMVTDLTYPRLLGKYFYGETRRILEDIPEILGDKFALTKWSLDEVVATAKKSHLAIFPLDPAGTLNPLKPENRLLMMWRVGLPVLTSPSLAYNRVMAQTELDGICSSPTEWSQKVVEMIDSPELRKRSVERGQQYIRDTHSEKIVLEAWDKLFESVL